MSTPSKIILTMATFLFFGMPSTGQFPWFYSPGWFPHGFGSGFGPGAALTGAANVISSTGQLYIDQERARVERERANQAKIETRRQTFDQMMYERANTPTFTENQEKVNRMSLRRIMNNPLEAEVTSGRAQNMMLPYLNRLLSMGIQGPSVDLDQNMLRSINVTSGNLGNIGLLRDGGNLDWPLALRSPTQQKLAPLFPKLVSAAMAGNLDLGLFTQANKGVAALRQELRSRFHNEEIDGRLFLEGQRFLNSLESSMRMIRSPNAVKFIDGTFAATGRDVPELVANMTSRGLTFAPATPGNEAAYFGLQNALVSFAAGAESNEGFRATFDPLVQAPRKDFSK